MGSARIPCLRALRHRERDLGPVTANRWRRLVGRAPFLGTASRRLIAPLGVAVGALVATVAGAGAQCPDGTPAPCAHPARPPAANSVAVLYFDNLSRDTADVFLADGLTDELIVRLSQVKRLEVKSRFESLRVRGRRVADPRALGSELHAAHLVTGSLQQTPQRLRLNVSLVRTRDGAQEWGQVYDRAGSDILALQTEIAREVAGAITGQLLPEERVSLAHRPTADPVAYNLYLRGIGAANTSSEAGMRAGLEYFNRAIARDSSFADAYAEKAMVWATLADGYVEGRVGYARAREAAAQALRFDSSVALAWAMLGQAALALDADAPRATGFAERALGLDARSSWAHITLVGALLLSGRHDDSVIAEGRRGWESDTLSAVTAFLYLWALDLAQHAGSIPLVLPRMQAALSPAEMRIWEGPAYLARGDAAGAAERLSWSYYGGVFAGEYVRALSLSGRNVAARAAVDSMLQLARGAYFNAYGVARAFAALGAVDDAFAWLDRAWDQRTIWLTEVRVDSELEPLHADPRWPAFLRRMGLTP